MNSSLKFTILALLSVISTGYTFAADVPKALLLRPAGWIYEWSNGDSKSEGTYLFQARDQKVVVLVSASTPTGAPYSCEHDVTINADTVSFDGCKVANISLHYDASDPDYPFKGQSSSDTSQFRLKAK